MKHNKIIYFLSGGGIIAIIVVIIIYRNLFGINIRTDKHDQAVYIPTGASFEQVMDTIESNLTIRNQKVLEWLAKKKNYPDLIRPGRYIS